MMKQRRAKMAYALRWFSIWLVVYLSLREGFSVQMAVTDDVGPGDISPFVAGMVLYLPIAFGIFTAFRALALVLESFDKEEGPNENSP